MMAVLVLKVRQACVLARQVGWFATLKRVWLRLRTGPTRSHLIDVFAHYDFVLPKVLQSEPGNRMRGTINWFIPDFNVGSGGHLNIFRTIWHLEQQGYESRIVIVKAALHHTPMVAEHAIQTHFFPLKAKVYIGLEKLPSSEFAVATGWDTAYPVRDFNGADYKLYFVQDYEPDFYPVGTEWVLAENTYRFGFFGITAGDWLAEKLKREYGMATHAVGFGVEHGRYQRRPRREPHIRRVFFYARPPTPRRAFEIGLMVLQAVWLRQPETQFILAGWDTTGYHVPFPHLACGTVALDDLPDLYSQCDVALVLSLTNISLLPLELMACGCAVVSNQGPNVEWLLNDDIAVLSGASPEQLTDAVCNLLQDDERRRSMSARAEAFAHGLTWEAVAQGFEVGLQEVRDRSLQGKPPCVA